MTMNHRSRSTPGAPIDGSNQLLKYFSSHEGCRILTTIINDEYRLLQETKRILDKRTSLDIQYAKNLQDLTATADRIAWPIDTHPIASISREIFLQWSHSATMITSNAEQFRKNVIENLLKELIEQKLDSKKFLEDEKRRYDGEHRKAQMDVAEAERRYLDEARSYVTRNNNLTKAQNNARKGDDSRKKHLKDLVIEKRGQLYRAHNEYVLKIREYNFIDEQYVLKIQNLIQCHQDIQIILNKSWQNLLEAIANYASYHQENATVAMEKSRQMIFSVHPRQCYDEMCKIHSNIASITTTPQVFNKLLLQTSGIVKLKADEFIVDSSTKQDLKQRIEILTNSTNKPAPKSIDLTKDQQISYNARKNVFEQEQQINYLRTRQRWEEQLRDELRVLLKNVGYRSDDDDDTDLDSDEDLTDRLEDQAYFHGVIPRHQTMSQLTEKGDYLVRINEQGKIVLSILWTDPTNPSKLKHGHFFINEENNMYVLQPNGTSKPTVTELLAFYKRQKSELRDDGTRLIRAIARPDYVINNDEVRTLEILGRGHFGQVVRGEYRGQNVAVKILHPSSVEQTARDRQNFVNEALLLQQYKHKNIVKFLGIAAIRDPLMIIMELIEQGSLDKYLRNNEIRISQLTQMCYDIAKGMKYLEKSNVIHRDLAARNCLVDRRGRIKVADFGLSRCLQSDEEYFCQVKEVPVRWWAVEVFSNAPYTIKSDVWSYGVTAWEVFAKADIPYPHIQHNHLVINAVKHGERLKKPEKCPTRIYSILTTCWDSEPKDRPHFEKIVELLKKEKSLF